jgi:hypothetical protein
MEMPDESRLGWESVADLGSLTVSLNVGEAIKEQVVRDNTAGELDQAGCCD